MDAVLNFLIFDDNDGDLLSLAIQLWLSKKSLCQVWLKERRIFLRRILRDSRIGVVNFLHETVPRYPDIQFHEDFRMSRSTFQVLFLNF